jgi:hypothetical protein
MMPRRPAEIEYDIPLYLVPHIVARGIRKHGDTIEQVIIKTTHRHFYNVSIRTRPVRKEFKGDTKQHQNTRE